ncbi:MAG: hypothetical protein EHM70_18850, partial [Chloroflexota bacterium]
SMARLISLYVDFDRCQACLRCQATQDCRTRAIIQVDPGEPPYLDIERCRDCQVCVPACPFGAVRRADIE